MRLGSLARGWLSSPDSESFVSHARACRRLEFNEELMDCALCEVRFVAKVMSR